MLMLTQDAAEVVRDLADEPGAEGLRISSEAQSLNGQGPQLSIEVVAAPEPEDLVVETDGAPIFLSPDAAGALDGKVLDAEIDGDQVQFALLELSEGDDEPSG